MRRGAFALIDVLGFKGIWRRHPEDAVIRSLEALMATSQEDARLAMALGQIADFVAPVFLSDTVAFGLTARPLADVNATMKTSGEIVQFDEHTLDSWVVWHMGNFLAHLMRRALVAKVPMAFRGAIAFGRFGMTDRFIIGEAVDEAAPFHEAADAAIVGLTPSAEKFAQAEVPSPISKFFRYGIPKKQGHWNTWAVLPWGEPEDPKLDLIDLYGRILATEEPSVQADVDRKRQNTLAFLRAADEAAEAPMRALREQLLELPEPRR